MFSRRVITLRASGFLLAAVCVASAFACSNVLGITDVPDGATASTDAGDDGFFDDFDSNFDFDGGSDDSATEKDTGTPCISGGEPCGAFSGGSPKDPGGDCCSQFCIGNSDGTAGVCGEDMGSYSISYNQTDSPFLGAFLDNSFGSPSIVVSFDFPGEDDPTHQTGFSCGLTAVASGCAQNFASFMLSDGTIVDGYQDDGGAACGLNVQSLPPDTIEAQFSGILADSKGSGVTLDINIFQPYP